MVRLGSSARAHWGKPYFLRGFSFSCGMMKHVDDLRLSDLSSAARRRQDAEIKPSRPGTKCCDSDGGKKPRREPRASRRADSGSVRALVTGFRGSQPRDGTCSTSAHRCAELKISGVDHVLIGGLAVNAHGVIRSTKDIDICPSPDGGQPLSDSLTLLRRLGVRAAWRWR